jgi:soluble lytic murein transglycosylase-like protein
MSRLPVSLAITLTACTITALSPSLAIADIAVFTDGRILKVDDAFLEDGQIVLDLRGGGRMVVPAIRIERVVADEYEEPDPPGEFAHGDCSLAWEETSLPQALPFRSSIEAAAQSANLHPLLLTALVQAESDFDPRAVSRVGASGLTQLMPATAVDQQVDDVFDPDQNLRGGAHHLRELLDRFDTLPLALAAYNAGAATVDRYRGVPPYRETRTYVRRILDTFCPAD